jgi:hypothetical protein
MYKDVEMLLAYFQLVFGVRFEVLMVVTMHSVVFFVPAALSWGKSCWQPLTGGWPLWRREKSLDSGGNQTIIPWFSSTLPSYYTN